MSEPKIQIHQIFYDEPSRKALDPRAIPLDNREGPSHWYEFWAILNFLRNTTLEEDTFYAFLSPSFAEKSGFTIPEVEAIVARERDRDVIVFSSFWIALFLTRNPWLHAERIHPGVLSRAQAFFDAIGEDVDLAGLTTDSTTSGFSNYFVAKPAFWRAWVELAEKYYAYVEAQGPDGPHQDTTDYRGERAVAFKVFIQERLASHVLLANDFDTVMPDHPFRNAPADPERLRAFLKRIDHLKRRYRATGNPLHLVHIRLLETACSRVARGGSFAAWAWEGLRPKIARAVAPLRGR